MNSTLRAENEPRIVFFGTPEFAVASLDALLRAGIRVVGVVTVPDRPAGRGLNLMQSPVKIYALSRDITLLQPVNLKDPEFLGAIAALNPDIQVVVAFRMLPREIWSLPTHGTFNLHASLLPQYRGAAPINRVIMAGERETGVTTFFINDELDTGAILFQRALKIGPDETAGQLHDRLKVIGAELVVKTVREISMANVQPRSQEELTPGSGILRKAPKLRREDTLVQWDKDTCTVYNQIRGLSPYPGAGATLPLKDGSLFTVKLGLVRPLPPTRQLTDKPGKIVSDRKNFMRIATKDGLIDILEVQPASKKLMQVRDFLNGYGGQLS